MSAPSLSELFQLERWLEEAFQYGLVAQTVIAGEAIDISRQSTTALSPRIELKAIVGEELQHHHLEASGSWTVDAWTGELEVLIVTNRQIVNGTNIHYQLIGGVRACFKAHYANRGNPPEPVNPLSWWPTTSYLAIADIRFAGTDDTWSDEQNLDYTKLKYSLLFNVKPESWP